MIIAVLKQNCARMTKPTKWPVHQANSNQPGHMPSVMSSLCTMGWTGWMLRLFLQVHRSSCLFCHALAQFRYIHIKRIPFAEFIGIRVILAVGKSAGLQFKYEQQGSPQAYIRY